MGCFVAGPAGPLLVGPLLAELRPRSVLVVGPETEALALRRLLAAASLPDTRLTAFEALPRRGRFEAPDCVFWCGDPNWHTAFHNLSGLAARTRKAGSPYPVVFVDHVGWPYGRRDGYARPGAIPVAHRNASRRLGLRPSAPLPVSTGGFHGERHNGVFAWGSRNGVVTAVEDFLAQGPGAGLRFAKVPGFHPVGVLADPRRVVHGGRLADFLADPAGALGRWGVARDLARYETEARRSTMEALQRATLSTPPSPEALDDLPPPEASGDVLRDLLRWTLLSHRFHAQLLRVLDEALTEAGIPYAVAEGTLLGAVRHGGPIPHDDDVDVVVAEGDMDRMRQALEGVGLSAAETPAWASLGRTFVVGILHPHVERCGYWHTRPAVDVFPVTEGADAMMRPDEMFPLTRIPYCDFSVSAPVGAQSVLERRFGPGWTSECKIWQHGSVPGVAKEGGSMPLSAYQEICDQEGYVRPVTFPLATLPRRRRD